MTNTPSPTDEDRDLVERLKFLRKTEPCRNIGAVHEAADRLESLLSDRAKLEERVRELSEAGSTLAETVKLIKAALSKTLTKREMEILMADLHAWNVAVLNRSTDRAT